MFCVELKEYYKLRSIYYHNTLSYNEALTMEVNRANSEKLSIVQLQNINNMLTLLEGGKKNGLLTFSVENYFQFNFV